jgi:LPS sulfotransferase NodH
VRQAISKAKALQSGLWKVQSGNSATGEPVFDFDLIHRCLEETREDERVWERFFEAQGITPHTVIYEDLCENYDVTIRSTLAFLGVKIPHSLRIEPATVRQSDRLSEEWETTYLKLAPGEPPTF